jgi:cell division protein FtsQ
MPARARSRQPAARSATAALPRRRLRVPAGIGSLLRRAAPSRRSLAVGLGILAVALSGYAIARETSIFALTQVDVRGGSSRVDAQVKQALAPLLGTSLVGLDGGAAIRRVEALPTVVSASYDRAFPHTLRITIVPEQPVAVLRKGATAWLVSRRGRVMEPLAARADPSLPHIWLGGARKVAVGELLLPADGGVAAKALGLAGAFGGRVATAALVNGTLVFRLRSGIELLLGSPSQVALKVAVATQALTVLPSGSRFLDVSVPDRPVSGTRNPSLQPSSRGRG